MDKPPSGLWEHLRRSLRHPGRDQGTDQGGPGAPPADQAWEPEFQGKPRGIDLGH